MKIVNTVMALTVLAAPLGCGGSAYPKADPTRSLTEISAAEAMGAERVPAAQFHLKLARDQVATARWLLEDGENDQAYRVLRRAEEDARLARDYARDATLKQQADREMQRVDELRRSAR